MSASRYSVYNHPTGSFLPVLVLLISWRLVLLLPLKKAHDDETEPENSEMQELGPVPQTSMLPTSNMMLSMQSAAGAPPIPSSERKGGMSGKKISQTSSFAEGEGGLLY